MGSSRLTRRVGSETEAGRSVTEQWIDGYGSIGRDVSFGYLDQRVEASKKYSPNLVLNSESGTVLQALRGELRTATSFTFSVAFISAGGIALLKQAFLDFEGVGEIITSDYLGFNSPSAFAELLELRSIGVSVRRHTEGAFHPKGYVFRHADGITAILGSSNLTESALVSNHEWNIRVSAATESDLAEQFMNLLDRSATLSTPLTSEWIDEYSGRWVPPIRGSQSAPATPSAPGVPHDDETIRPNTMQAAALQSVAALRESGAQRALVISATGTGKTILAALDVRAANPKRLLFVAHREQILDRAIEEFRRVLGGDITDYGKLVGQSRDVDRKYVFSTVQTLSQPETLANLDPNSFDYVLIDEVHRATAPTYQRVINHFHPDFLLGLTATPERSDGTSVFELFHFNVPYEIRLNAALEQGMLSPFHYYGVADITFEDGTTTTDATPLFRLLTGDRVDHILTAIRRYGQAGARPRGLIFCSRKEEARELSRLLNERELRGKNLRTVALTGEDAIEVREEQVKRLESGELDYILTVDVFNEGVDIPSVNQVLMLRQTQSAIVFVQQLGRGLRKSPSKEYLVVIDFIGNYANNYLIPIALFGDDSLNRESIRRSLIAAEERGAIAGLSSVSFDRIAHQRVMRSLQTAQLDSLHNLKIAIETIRNRIGQMPVLQDFLRFESVDPVVLATKVGSYPSLIQKLFAEDHGLSSIEERLLALLGSEVLAAKRVHESVVMKTLLTRDNTTVSDVVRILAESGLRAEPFEVGSAIRAFTRSGLTAVERSRFGGVSAATLDDEGRLSLAPDFRASFESSAVFRDAVEDILATSQRLVVDRYHLREPFTVAAQYTRMDARRILGWPGTLNGQNIGGYWVDRTTFTCGIFVTLRKAEDVSASTAYEDAILDPSTMVWFSKSKRTLDSPDVSAITSGDFALHVFVRKDDADGAGHYYLGRASAHGAEDTRMRGGARLPVVRMFLKFEQRIDPGVYSYFHPELTD